MCFLPLTRAKAQLDLTRVYGPEDSDVPTPPFHVALGQQDAGALQVLIDYLKAVNVGQWHGFKGTGTYRFESMDGGNANQASLSVSQGDRSRLDVQTSDGILSTRIAGSYGLSMDPSGKRWPMPSRTATLGLLFFPKLLVSTFPTPKTSLIDQGEIQIQGRRLHKVTVAEPLLENETESADPSRISVVDLYFDVTTHLLIKSAATVQLDSADHTHYVQVVTYDDYRKSQNNVIAYRFHQSLNGQPQWTLQLSSVDQSSDTNEASFYF